MLPGVSNTLTRAVVAACEKALRFQNGTLDPGDIVPLVDIETHQAVPNYWVIEDAPWEAYYYLAQQAGVAIATLFERDRQTQSSREHALLDALEEALKT